jgi:hypothetical protein
MRYLLTRMSDIIARDEEETYAYDQLQKALLLEYVVHQRKRAEKIDGSVLLSL